MASSTPSSELPGYGPPEAANGAHALDGYGPPEPIEDASVDMGQEARHRVAIFGRPKMPEPKSDEELGIDSGPLFGTITSKPRSSQAARDAPGTSAYSAYHAGDEMNDPGAQLITGAALAAPLAAVAGAAAPAAVAPMVGGAVSGAQQAAMVGANPLIGAGLGALPGVPTAARAADAAIGEAALARATAPGFGSGPGPVARAAGKVVGMTVGGATHGPLGILVGHDLGGRAANLFSRAGDAATSALARRFMEQEANLAAPNMVQIAPPAPPPPLAPLVHEPLPPPARVPNGALGTPFLDEISGEPVTQAGQGGFLPEEAATNAGAKPSSLRKDVIRDAQALRRAPIEENPGEPPAPLESQLERSVRMLSELKTAARAGKVSPTMIQEALSAGMSPQAVAKTVGREAFERATQ